MRLTPSGLGAAVFAPLLLCATGSAQFTDEDELFEDQSSLQLIGAPHAWETSTGSPDVIIAIIDTGVDYNHPDLAPNMWFNTNELGGVPGQDDDPSEYGGYVDDYLGYDFMAGDTDPMDDGYHGTYMAGIAAARGNNGIGIAGVCWNCSIMAIRFTTSFGGGTCLKLAQAINYAVKNGANVINRSGGTDDGTCPELDTALEAALDANVLVVTSAGNQPIDRDVVPQYPANSNFGNVLTVGGTDETGLFWVDSGFGDETVDFAAPAAGVLGTLPCVVGCYSVVGTGTSQAAALVSGAAGVLLAAEPNLRNNVGVLKSLLVAPGEPIAAEIIPVTRQEPGQPAITSPRRVNLGHSMDELAAHGTGFPDLTRCHDGRDNDGDGDIDLDDDECGSLYQAGECGQGAAGAMLIPPFLWLNGRRRRRRRTRGTGR